jgi:hypothetical protein
VPDAEVLALSQDMTIARDEFLRSLPAALAGAAFAADGREVRPVDPGQGWRIVLDPLPDLRLGAIRLPRHRVTIYLAGRDEAATRRFLERFELYFRRGGG